MAIQEEKNAHAALVGGGETSLHSHAGGGGGPNIKAGTLAFNTDTWTAVLFGTSFATVPKVVVTADQSSVARWDFTPIIRNVTVAGFDVRYDDRGQAGSVIVGWIATDAGNY